MSDHYHAGRAVTAYGDYLRWIGHARYAYAEARYREALAAQEWIRARAWYDFARLLHNDIDRILRSRYYQDRALRRIDDNIVAMRTIADGKLTPRALSAIRFFLRFPGYDLVALADWQIPSLDEAQFLPRAPYRTRYDREQGVMVKEPILPEAFPGGNMLAYLAWLEGHSFHVAAGSEAQRQLLILVQQLGSVWIGMPTRLEEARVAIENDPENLWNPPHIVPELGTLPMRRPPKV